MSRDEAVSRIKSHERARRLLRPVVGRCTVRGRGCRNPVVGVVEECPYCATHLREAREAHREYLLAKRAMGSAPE